MPPKKSTPGASAAKPKTTAKAGAKPAVKKTGTTTAKKAPAKTTPAKTAAKVEEKPAAAAEDKQVEEKPKILPGVTINLKQLNTVLIGDDDGKIKESGRWPLVIDQGGVTGRFLRHRDVNYLEALDQNNMAAERIRLAILGGIRFGKPVVIDMHNMDLWDSIEKFFDNVETGLLKMVMDKSILKEENYKQLIKDTDDQTYTTLFQYSDQVIERFGFWILTMKADPEKKLMEQVYPIRIE